MPSPSGSAVGPDLPTPVAAWLSSPSSLSLVDGAVAGGLMLACPGGWAGGAGAGGAGAEVGALALARATAAAALALASAAE